MNILRFGGINRQTSRFLDLVKFSEVESITFAVDGNEKKYMDDLYSTASYFGENRYLKKITVLDLPELSKIKRGLRRISRKFQLQGLLEYVYKSYKSIIDNSKKPDIVWIGDNDFDGSNFLFAGIYKYLQKGNTVRSYKETRFDYKWEEKLTLDNSDRLILPCKNYISFFKNLYGEDYSNKTDFADLDWRYSKTIEWVKNLNIKKLSIKDGKPHVCILTGRALSDPTEKRSGSRYYFVPLIEELIKHGIKVHLHAMRIVESKNPSIGNPYKRIADETGHLFIEKPLRLTAGSKDYEILKRYDAGVLHPPVIETKEALNKFQEINIPNRLYEYQIADVVPITEKGSTPEVEKIIERTGFGIEFSTFDELAFKLNELVKGNINGRLDINKINSFADFSRILLESR